MADAAVARITDAPDPDDDVDLDLDAEDTLLREATAVRSPSWWRGR